MEKEKLSKSEGSSTTNGLGKFQDHNQ